jgi:serine/threonine-protein kinase
MKHVRDALPDVQAKRPDVSAALAKVIDTATAKRVEDRYGDDAELVADLEDALAIETARAGNAGGEVTAVLRTLPAPKRRRIPYSLRHRVITATLGLVLIAGIVAAGIWLASRAHHGTGRASQPPPSQLAQVGLCQTCAHAYNPNGLNGDTTQNDNQAGLAVDNDLQTKWQTQQYYSGTLGKPGVGLYVDATPRVIARELRLVTDTPGFAAQVWARNTIPRPGVADFNQPDGWVRLTNSPYVHHTEDISLPGAAPYRYYLVWIVSLPPGQNSVSINEIALYK